MELLRALVFVANCFQAQWVANHDGLSERKNESLIAPLRENTANCEQSRAGHLREFLTRERNLNSAAMRFANALEKPMKSQSQTLRDLFGGYFTEPLFKLL